MTKAGLEVKLYDSEQECRRLEAALSDACAQTKEAKAEATAAEDRADEAEDNALKPMRTADEWLCLLGEHLDRMRDGLIRRSQVGKALPGWERWEECARECLSEAQGLIPV